jgi:hypothetical protein
MGLIRKSLVAVGLAAGIANYFVYVNTGKVPLADLYERWGSGWTSKVANPTQLLQGTTQLLERSVDTGKAVDGVAYRWRDSDGVMHFSDKRPAGVDPSTIEEVRIPAPAMILASPDTDLSPRSTTDTAGSPIEKARAAAQALEARSAIEPIE